MRKNSKVILLAEEQLVFGRSLRNDGRARQSTDRRAGLPLARIAGRKDRPKETRTPAVPPSPWAA